MGTHRNRHSKGTRQGGRFAATARSEAGIGLIVNSAAEASLDDVHYLREHAGTPAMETEEFRHSLDRVLDYTEGQLDDGVDFDTPEDRRKYYEALDLDIEYSMIEQQRTLLVGTAEELKEQCPEVGTLDLEFDDHGAISVKDARKRDGSPAADADKEAILALLRWGNPDAYDRIMNEPIDIDEAIAWRPAAA